MTDRSSEKLADVPVTGEPPAYQTPKLAVYGSLMELTLSGTPKVGNEAFPQGPGKRLS